MNVFWSVVKGKLSFFISFIFSKTIVFIAPIILAEVLNKEDYGIIEYALAGLGFVLNGVINLGVPGAYPYYILKEKEMWIKNGFKLHPLWLSIVFILNQIVFILFELNAEIYLSINVAYIISNQIFYSTQYKSHEKPTLAVFLDSGIYLVLLISFILFKTKVVNISIQTINNIIIIYALIYLFVGGFTFLKSKKEKILKHYKIILRYSSNLMVATFLIFLISASGRILVEWFFTFDEVAVYGYYFRLSAIVVMIHQVVNIAFFKKIYTLNPRTLDFYFSYFFFGIFILSIICFLLAPKILGAFSTFFTNTYEENKELYFLLSSQMIMWIASALNSSIVDRENLAKSNNYRFSILIGIGICILYLLRSSLNLTLLVYVHYSIIFCACLVQFYSLYTKQIFFQKSLFVLTLTFVVTSLIYFIW